MPTIRFENSDEGYKGSAGNLLKSLNLDPARCQEDQEFELTSQTKVQVFGMQVPVPTALTNEKHWSCRVVGQDGSCRLMVGDYLWAADVAAGAVPEEAVEALTEHLEVICLSNLPIKDIGFLAKRPKITSLNLNGCMALTDLTPLSG
ncbi:leucine-rich repeat domain-containing protein, partial [Akkermansiaceae bacterium]|nr:leucine-rich repeat domain-containing protein [Akkermansiaceae bacterium]